MRRRCAVLLLGWGILFSSGLARAAAPPLPFQPGHCDDLDAESLVQALEAELPHLRETAARPAAVATAASPVAATAVVSAPADQASASAPAGPAAPRPTAAPRLRFGRVRMSLAEYVRSTLEPLLTLARRGRSALCTALPQEFELQRLAGQERGHFSAYFHPLLRGSRTRHGPYQIPLYRRPEDAKSQLTTAEILAGGLSGKSLELVYLESLGTALNVHIEGSATVQLDDGTELNLTTDGHNGHPYKNPFKLARQDGIIPPEPGPPQPPAAAASPPTAAANVSVAAASPGTAVANPLAARAAAPEPARSPRRSRTRVFFDEHPELLRKYWEKNPHFVFFKPTPLRGTGKFGQLIAGRSVAVDAARIPLGAALWMRTELASLGAETGGALPHSPIARLALAQDTGAAIRGIGRVDIFVGSGPAAERAAAFTSRPGELYLLVHKSPRSRPRARAPRP